MYGVSSKWLPALTAPRIQLATWAEVWSGIGGQWLATLQVEGGSVLDDWTAAIRRTCTNVLVTDPTGALSPTGIDSLLAAAGNELIIYKGLVYPGGNTSATKTAPYTPGMGSSNGFEAVPLGRFLIEKTEPAHTASGTYALKVSGSDRGGTVSRAKFTEPYGTTAGATADQVIQSIISAGVAGLSYNFTPDLDVIPATAYKVGDDRWNAAALVLASNNGQLLYFDRTGTAALTPIVDPTTQAVSITYGAGYVLLLTAVDRTVTNVKSPNWIIGISSGAGIPVPLRADWQDTDPSSPTYINGKYPTTVQKITSSTITTQVALQNMVNAQALQNKGLYDQSTFSIIDNAAQDAGDVIGLADPITGTTGTYIVDKVTHTLDYATALQGQARRIL